MSSHFDQLADVARNKATTIRIRYSHLYRILCVVAEEATAQAHIDFSGPFARLTYLLQQGQISQPLLQNLNALRQRCQQLSHHTDAALEASFKGDVNCLAAFICAITGEERPKGFSRVGRKSIGDTSPRCENNDEENEKRRTCSIGEAAQHLQKTSCGGSATSLSLRPLRVCVVDLSTPFLTVRPEDTPHTTLRLECPKHLASILHTGSQLNLLHCQIDKDLCTPELVVLEPDYLIDVSAIAACFKAYGTSHYHYLLSRLNTKTSTPATLLGNLASQLLDEEVARLICPDAVPANYAQSALHFMRRNALELLDQDEMPATFHPQAQAQQANLRKLLADTAVSDSRFKPEEMLLEASFFCEALGLQGRMDMIGQDGRVLVEQKSGKRDDFHHRHQETHYVQMLLYLAMLHYGRGLRNDQVSCYLLYSKYPDGMLREGNAPQLLRQAIEIRNRMVALDFYIARHGSSALEKLTAEMLHTGGNSEALWQGYVRQPLEQQLTRITEANPMAKAYYHRMMQFVAREHLLAKIGAPGREADGMASLWRSPLQEKLLAGNILMELSIQQTLPAESPVTEEIVFSLSKTQDEGIPNFRTGDIVLAYPYPTDATPDVRHAIVCRASVMAFGQDTVRIKLRDTQHNPQFFLPTKGIVWALEHDHAESGFAALYRSLAAFLHASSSRQQLLLGQRDPGINKDIALQGDYSMDGRSPHFNQLVLQARQAQDYFLLIGPPGTGKTSFGMLNILREGLAHPNEHILLLSYTNRAVDEMCSKLVAQGIDFIRMGNEASCDAAYHGHLFHHRMTQIAHLDEAREIIRNTRVFASTTSSLTAHSELLRQKTFAMAIIDEASQILEPQLMTILCAENAQGPAIQKFILIGDHKQLPAVVQQSTEESTVENPLLHQAALFNCRESLFQRLLRIEENRRGNHSPFVFRFQQQGRMHPAVANFAVAHFYENNLAPIPLPHQDKKLHFPIHNKENRLVHKLATRRTLFLPVKPPVDNLSPKTNRAEAEQIAQVAGIVYQLYTQNNRPFTPQTIGIIVPYRLQIVQVQLAIQKLGIEALNHITIDTVERYQGSERDVIIYGFTVRMPYQMDFLCSQQFEDHGHIIDRKLNVAITRAREQLIFVGNPKILARDAIHKRLVEGMKG